LKEGDFGLNGYAGKPAQLVYYNSNPYIAILKEEAGGTLVADKVYPLTQTGSTFTASTQQEPKQKAEIEQKPESKPKAEQKQESKKSNIKNKSKVLKKIFNKR
jgi:hypothetical protein